MGFDSEIQRLYTEKLSLKQIAERLGISRDRVRTGLARAKIRVKASRRSLDLTGQTPFGWKKERGKLAFHGAEQKIISRMVEARRAGLSLHAIARTLSEEGVKTKAGGRWHAKSVSQILECNARLLKEHERLTRESVELIS